jgi:hypothetical protein
MGVAQDVPESPGLSDRRWQMINPVTNRSTNSVMASVPLMTAPMKDAPAITGLSRSALYRAAGEGRIVLRKMGRTTLVDLESVHKFIEQLPLANISAASSAK